MQKAKFKIAGMNCKSCAALIEEKLNNLDGVLQARADFNSEKAVVAFDESKNSIENIQSVIEQSGDFQVERVVDEAPVREAAPYAPVQNPNITGVTVPMAASPKSQFILGALISFSVLSLVANIVMGVALFRSTQAKTGSVAGIETNNAVAAAPDADTNTAPTPAVATPQTFTVTKDDHIRGDFNAPVTLVEFSDFECPFCGKIYPTFKQALNDYKGKVRLVYKYFPLLSIHPNSEKAAEAAECASEQGKFWEYHDKLFDNQSAGFSTDKFKQWASDLGLNAVKFNGCLDAGKYQQKVQDELKEGEQKGVNGTPATFINGTLVSGALPYDTFKQAIDAALSKT